MRIRRLPCLLVFALAALAGAGAHAACESGLAERMHAKLHPKRKLDESLAACKPWPAYPGRSIVVLPLVNGAGSAHGKVLDLEVLVIQRPDNGNTERDTVLARLFQPEALEEDVIRIQDIRIDTGRYVLSPDARAFGLRVRYSSSSRTHPLSSETLRLYVPQGSRLREVLGEVEVEREGGEWDLRCNGRFEQLRTMLSVGKARSDGYADLSLARSLTQSRAQLQDDGECHERALTPHYSTEVLHYDGERYRVPKSLRTP
ncbi:Uncharacterised protein [Xylophilus ampelinus]|nr:hypothetical protein [Variovorax sp.]VTY37195.1 Uncharacterised protein [Xylophilus ampelinus]